MVLFKLCIVRSKQSHFSPSLSSSIAASKAEINCDSFVGTMLYEKTLGSGEREHHLLGRGFRTLRMSKHVWISMAHKSSFVADVSFPALYSFSTTTHFWVGSWRSEKMRDFLLLLWGRAENRQRDSNTCNFGWNFSEEKPLAARAKWREYCVSLAGVSSSSWLW